MRIDSRTAALVSTPVLAASLLATLVAAAPAASAKDARTAPATSAEGARTAPAASAEGARTVPAAAARTRTPHAARTGAAPATPGWKRCTGADLDPRQECATISVPLDYAKPRGAQITLAISRVRSERPQARRGTLLLIPGGPGSSGINRPSTLGKKLPRSVRDAYDIVGFDPRGLGGSTPISCGLAHDDLALVHLRPWPDADGGIERNVSTGRRLAQTCARNGGPVLRSISTANEARDIDRIRQALGERKLSAWGVSYGTYAGAVYAQMFPRRTDRWVLDSSDDPDPKRVARGWLANYATGVEDAFPDFAAWAADPGNPHRLADSADEVRPLFLKLAARLDRAPIPWPGANPAELNGNVLRQSLLDALYSTTRFPALARLIRAARDGSPLPAPNTPPDEALQSSVAVSAATICNDVSWPASIPDYERDVAESRRTHPLTAGLPANLMPCAFWPYAPKEKPVRITPGGPSNVLMIQNRRDPSTPLVGALRMREALGGRARMVTVDAVGHGAYRANGNACGDAAVTDFLVRGDRPARDVSCPAA
ncbi:alpha/beta hydrolase [Streptomyces sp. XD-27]|uniref:alpha/beta hydrolase n=1 Tax=Streptomyces sp. XD-27 TaxID=3062779 RepID=UPI0026F47CD3|nr:alpha/beta hydrolase [Streptomyces sp. XD-27]WKX71874.1 alpha/beta hydrolase [Streptomyces sp. XD-27]